MLHSTAMATNPSTAARQEPGLYIALTHDPLDPTRLIDRVRSPEAGAIVLFAGTTRNSFADRPVRDLAYQSYTPLALTTLHAIASSVRTRHGLKAIAVVHRLGTVPVGEESILIAVSSPHRKEAWLAGEECLEEVKARAEIWKLERFVDDEGGVWRANRDGALGVREPAAGPRDDGASAEVGQGKGEHQDMTIPETVIRPP